MAHHDASLTQAEPGFERFAALIRERTDQGFAHGERDCALFAADCVAALTGIDHAADVRGAYTTEQGAARLLARHGGLAGVAGRVGPEIPPLCAAAGDVGLLAQDGREFLAVCVGPHWAAQGPAGVISVPFGAAVRAWRAASA